MYKCALTILIALIASGCCKGPNYTNAYQLPELQFPPHSLPVSHRYDIPAVANNNNCHVIDTIQPPYY